MFSFHVVQGSSCKKYFKIKIFLRNRISKNCSWKIAILELIKRMKNVSTLLSKSLFVYCRYQLNNFCISLLLYYPNFNGKYEAQTRMIKSLRITVNCKSQILGTDFTWTCNISYYISLDRSFKIFVISHFSLLVLTTIVKAEFTNVLIYKQIYNA